MISQAEFSQASGLFKRDSSKPRFMDLLIKPSITKRIMRKITSESLVKIHLLLLEIFVNP